MTAQPGNTPAPVTFRVTTYWKRGRNDHGLTQMGSNRLSLHEALDWILNELPDEAADVILLDEDGQPLPEGSQSDRVRIEIRWDKVPDEIREGARFTG